MSDMTNKQTKKDHALSKDGEKHPGFKRTWHKPKSKVLHMEDTFSGGDGYTDGTAYQYSS